MKKLVWGRRMIESSKVSFLHRRATSHTQDRSQNHQVSRSKASHRRWNQTCRGESMASFSPPHIQISALSWLATSLFRHMTTHRWDCPKGGTNPSSVTSRNIESTMPLIHLRNSTVLRATLNPLTTLMSHMVELLVHTGSLSSLLECSKLCTTSTHCTGQAPIRRIQAWRNRRCLWGERPASQANR